MEGKAPEQEFEQKPIRTYESDLAEAFAQKKASQASIVLAEVDRDRAKQLQTDGPGQNGAGVGVTVVTQSDDEKSHWGKNLLKLLVSLILVGAGVMAVYYLYLKSPLSAPTPTITGPSALLPAIITPDQQKTIDITDSSPQNILSQIKSQTANNLSAGSILELVFGENLSTTTARSSLTRVTGARFISKVGLNPPGILTRSLTDSWMMGLYETSRPSPFIILTTNFFQNAFAGMLQWEPSMPNDIAGLLGIYIMPPTIPVIMTPPIATTTATTTATSTKILATSTKAISTSTATTSTVSTVISTPPESFFTLRGKFIDKVIQNKDIREFQAENGNILFLYSFIDNNTIVIAREESTLNEIITRFEKRAYIR